MITIEIGDNLNTALAGMSLVFALAYLGGKWIDYYRDRGKR